MPRCAIVLLFLTSACASPATTQVVAPPRAETHHVPTAEKPATAEPAAPGVEAATLPTTAAVDRREGWALAPTRAKPCWAFDNVKYFELVCDGATNPFADDELRWLDAIDADPGFEIPLDSPAYPSDVRPGMELTLITARGLVRRRVRGVSGQGAVRSDGAVGLRYSIRLEGPPVGAALAVGDV